MPALEPNPCDCPGAEEILADLDADILDLQPGERLWKLYCFHVVGHATSLRHRIYSKRKTDGRLALVTFAAHNPISEKPGENGNSGAPHQIVRSSMARVPDLSTAELERIIAAVRRESQAAAGACEVVDLTALDTLQAQIAWLERGADVSESS